MELKNVKLKSKLTAQEGVSQQTGKEWYKQSFLLEETGTNYPKPIVLTAWNDTARSMANIPDGTDVRCEVKIESREYQGRWYTDAIAMNCVATTKAVAAQPTATSSSGADDLPF